MDGILKTLDNFFSSILSFFDAVGNLIADAIYYGEILLKFIFVSVPYALTSVIQLPSVLVVYGVILIAISVVFLFIGRKGGD